MEVGVTAGVRGIEIGNAAWRYNRGTVKEGTARKNS
jgi:hypothetical protein